MVGRECWCLVCVWLGIFFCQFNAPHRASIAGVIFRAWSAIEAHVFCLLFLIGVVAIIALAGNLTARASKLCFYLDGLMLVAGMRVSILL